MEAHGWRLNGTELRQWLDGLIAEGREVIAPVATDALRLFRPIDEGADADLRPGKTRWAPKEWLFPRTESLYEYTLESSGPELRDPEPPDRERVLLGVRSCDAAGFTRLDAVFVGGRVVDPLYAARRERTTVVGLACREAEPECFCTAVNGSPGGTEGLDLQIVPLGDDWLIRVLTEKGEALVSDEWQEASRSAWELAEDQERQVAEQIGREPVPEDRARILEAQFEHPVWKEISRRCVSCSVCAYVCPSCSCFDVHHEGNAWGGREFRCWDACTHSLFTLHASGHNPRQGPAARYRQRSLHKFAYLAPDEEDVVRCVGCGRCTVHCPVGIDIHEAVTRVVASAGEA
jgi:ferredoxin